MRIHRLDFGITKRINIDDQIFAYYVGNCSCKFLDVDVFYITWLSYECMAGIYKDKARLYRIKKYLKARKHRST